MKIVKANYEPPAIARVQMDSGISLQLVSPPIGPAESVLLETELMEENIGILDAF